MKNQSSSLPSITFFAKKKARKLSLSIFIIGFLSTFLLSIWAGTYHYKAQLNQTLDLVSKSLSQPLALGGDFLPTQVIKTLVSSGNFKNAWITLPNQQTHINAHYDSHQPNFTNIKNKLLFWNNKAPYILTNRKIIYLNQEVGTLYASYKLPLKTVFGYVILLCFLFSIISFYLYLKILNLSKDSVSPFKEYSFDLDQSTDKETFLQNNNSKESFLEIATFNQILLNYIEKNKENETLIRKAITKAQTLKLAIRVKHDVLASLLIGQPAIESLNQNSQEVDILKSVFDRITNTIKDIPKIGHLTDTELKLAALCNENEPKSKEKWRPCHLAAFIYQIHEEVKLSQLNKDKSIKFDINCDSIGFSSFAIVEPNKFKRNLLNLYNNSIEAIKGNGTIKTMVTVKDEVFSITISDNGIGIPKNILPDIGKRGVSYNKKNGTGIGLSSAIEDFNRWDGEIIINSIFSEGTSIELLLPTSENDTLFPTSLALTKDMTIVIVDDDPIIHTIWKNKLNKVTNKDNKPAIIYADNIEKAQVVLDKLNRTNNDYILLIDNDLNHKNLTGFDLVKKMNLMARSVLVTSSGNNDCLYEKCSKINLPIIPKIIQKEIPIDIYA